MIHWKHRVYGAFQAVHTAPKPAGFFIPPFCRFSAQTYRARKYFDTLQLVEQLEREGFTKQQSLTIMQALHTVLEENFYDLTRTMVTKEEQERNFSKSLSRGRLNKYNGLKISYTQKEEFSQLRSELQALGKNDLASTRQDCDRIATNIEKLKGIFREEINHTLANVRLDLNLEKGRIREQNTVLELKIKETDTRIENEINNMKTQVEAIKLQIFQWLVGIITGGGALGKHR
ncbi:hypothetical protein MERGE_002585 [Pneumocystis wakefieldiae]|uniref:DUF1640 domain-containing protein n=1 Tax=Pneumocystis wakefieldiae TaxID=38082 RepID=A0A899FXS8_9ASCO|nr:hypothetical protein MERGE_002585 [Pneumocystis wakefieldiae]